MPLPNTAQMTLYLLDKGITVLDETLLARAYVITKLFGQDIGENVEHSRLATAMGLQHCPVTYHHARESVRNRDVRQVIEGRFSTRLFRGFYTQDLEELLDRDWSEQAKAVIEISATFTLESKVICRPLLKWATTYLGERHVQTAQL